MMRVFFSSVLENSTLRLESSKKKVCIYMFSHSTEFTLNAFCTQIVVVKTKNFYFHEGNRCFGVRLCTTVRTLLIEI